MSILYSIILIINLFVIFIFKVYIILRHDNFNNFYIFDGQTPSFTATTCKFKQKSR